MSDIEDIRKIIDEAVDNLPTLSPSALQIIEIANDMAASPKDLMNIIKVDPVLTGKFLKLINSTYFAMPQPITSLNRALILLGFNTIKNIALSSAVVEASSKAGKIKYFNLQDLWSHMLAVGVTSKLLAKAAGQPRQMLEEFFIAGLLHDVGEMILMKYVSEPYYAVVERARAEGRSVCEVAREDMGITRSDVGAKMSEHWKLPANLSQVISDQCAIKSDLYLARVVRVADRYCREQGFGYVCDHSDLEITSQHLQEIQLKNSDFQQLKITLPEEIEKAKVFLEKQG